MFDKEEWSIQGADTPEVLLGVVSNTVLVEPLHGKAYYVCIRVPSHFFPYMREVLKIPEELAKLHPVQFSLEQQEGIWYFAATYGRVRDIMDLWKYKDLPIWANRTRCL